MKKKIGWFNLILVFSMVFVFVKFWNCDCFFHKTLESVFITSQKVREIKVKSSSECETEEGEASHLYNRFTYNSIMQIRDNRSLVKVDKEFDCEKVHGIKF